MTTDWKALCAELVNSWTEGLNIVGPMHHARAALDQPEPEGLTDEELLMAYQHAVSSQVKSIVQSIGDYHGTMDEYAAVTLAGLHAVLARWGRLAVEPVPEEKWYSRFADWLEREMPRGTVIGDPLWWAFKIADYLDRSGRLAVETETNGQT